MNPRKFVADCDGYFVGKPGISLDAELVVRAVEKGLNESSLDSRQLSGQLRGRLDKDHPILKTFPPELVYSWVKTRFPSLVPANHPLRKTLEGHSDYVFSVAVDGDVIASGS